MPCKSIYFFFRNFRVTLELQIVWFECIKHLGKPTAAVFALKDTPIFGKA